MKACGIFLTLIFMSLGAGAQSGSIGGSSATDKSDPVNSTNPWPNLSASDLKTCRAEITIFRNQRLNLGKEQLVEYCGKKGEEESCESVKKWIKETSGDPIAWFIKGKDHCESSEDPCYGVSYYNEIRTGEERKEFIQYVKERASMSVRALTGPTDFDDSAVVKCQSKVFLAKLTGKAVKDVAKPTDRFGTLMIDRAQGNAAGWAVGFRTQDEADKKARTECTRHSPSCTIVMQFTNACGSYAIDKTRGSTAYGWAYGPNQVEVDALALQLCSERGGLGSQCMTRVWGCTGG